MRRKRSRPRPAIQRAFHAWYEGASARFVVPVLLGRRTDRSWTLTLGGSTTPALCSWLYGYGIAVSAEWGGVAWDLVLCLEAAPQRTPLGYLDHMVLPEHRELYASKDELWRAELFEPFLRWVNEELAPARRLGLWRTEEGGATWAKLLQPGNMAHPDVARAYALLSVHEGAGRSAAAL